MTFPPYDTSTDSADRIALIPRVSHATETLTALASALTRLERWTAMDRLVDAVRHLENHQRHTDADLLEFYERQRDSALGVLVQDSRILFALGHLLSQEDAVTFALDLLDTADAVAPADVEEVVTTDGKVVRRFHVVGEAAGLNPAGEGGQS